MSLFFLIEKTQLLIFRMGDEEFVAYLDYFFLVNHLKLIILYCFIMLLHLISTFLHIKSLLIPRTYVSIESIDYIHLISFELKAIMPSYSVIMLSVIIFAEISILVY